mgnify:CR=1 FL=1
MKTDMKSRLNAFIEKNKHAFLLLYFCIYFPWFHHLERTVTTHFHVIHTALDDRIPFCEYFIVPYLLWFGYVAWAVGYFYLKNKDEYFKLCAMLFTGMTVFLVISTIYPNGHYLRPAYFEHNNIFIQMVKWLYATDTPTNLFPSVHVFNSIAVNIAVWHSDNFKKNKAVRCFDGTHYLIHNVFETALRFRRCHRYGTCRIYVLRCIHNQLGCCHRCKTGAQARTDLTMFLPQFQ